MKVKVRTLVGPTDQHDLEGTLRPVQQAVGHWRRQSRCNCFNPCRKVNRRCDNHGVPTWMRGGRSGTRPRFDWIMIGSLRLVGTGFCECATSNQENSCEFWSPSDTLASHRKHSLHQLTRNWRVRDLLELYQGYATQGPRCRAQTFQRSVIFSGFFCIFSETARCVTLLLTYKLFKYFSQNDMTRKMSGTVPRECDNTLEAR